SHESATNRSGEAWRKSEPTLPYPRAQEEWASYSDRGWRRPTAMGVCAMKKTNSLDDGGVMQKVMEWRLSWWAVGREAIAIICTATVAFANGDQGKIVFVSDRTGSWQIYTVNPDGTDLFQVTNLAPTDDDGIFPSLSPNGKGIAFNYNAGDGPD